MTVLPAPRYWRDILTFAQSEPPMPVRYPPPSSRTAWALVLIAVPLVLLMLEILRGAVHETDLIAKQTLQSEIQTLQSAAMQRGEGLQTLIQAHEGVQRWPEI